ncbi:Serine/threonine-protein phosphatase 2A 55 kDa regulatory subunit B beta isoform [Bagarius yarrelli]|uniref:Serine/threonine-protein phosphatase 2A 55 kDa regulatory subunit B beta isoform n=1 Tax=Bagarius yarrelli TaxID=175774 RepID=A0A556UZE5_BAGYA|nr:Serine/threonine-protein phosphatase 2A 55 kDa regulatory subunit B beta isoform [Bagarius yarrelli]
MKLEKQQITVAEDKELVVLQDFPDTTRGVYRAEMVYRLLYRRFLLFAAVRGFSRTPLRLTAISYRYRGEEEEVEEEEEEEGGREGANLEPSSSLVMCVCVGGERRKDEIGLDSMGFSNKIMHAAWHPSENIIAVAATNNLYIFQDKSRTIPGQVN